jgi:cytochrome c553
MRRCLAPVAIGLGLAALVAGAVVALGLVPLRASSGHWRITAWILDFAKRRSVALDAVGIDAPALDNAFRIRRGAGAYEQICRPCHGAPGPEVRLVSSRMTPHPPDLTETVSRWAPEELSIIVRYGIKLTGMPAWAGRGRDDEVWDVVAFLRRLPGLSAEDYAALAGRPAVAADAALSPGTPAAVAITCSRCHGADHDAFPDLHGQRPAYLHAALDAFASGGRPSGVMGPIAAGLDPDTRARLAAFYGEARHAHVTVEGPDDQAESRGAAIAHNGLPAAKVPACVDCHGISDSIHPAYPVLAGQPADYLVRQLELFQSRTRAGSAFAPVMHRVAAGLTPEAMRAVAEFYARH